MKKILCLLASMMVMTGCTMGKSEMDEALAFRSRILGANSVRFEAEITADYIDRVEEFDLACETDSAGALTFRVTEPDEISGITGTVTGEEGTLTFDETVLAFPLMDDGRFSPVSGPWVMMKALRSGYITAVAREGEMLRITVEEHYDEDALTVDIWLEGEEIDSCEISWRGRRQLTMELGEFSIG